MSDKLDPFDVAALEKSLNDSAVRVSTIWVSFLIFSLYLLVAAATVEHRQLFLAEPIKLPVLNIDLPLWGFFFLAPILFVIFHAYVLLQVLLLGRTAAAYDEAVTLAKLSPVANISLRQRLANTLFAQIFAGSPREREGWLGWLLRTMAWITLAIAPVLILLVFQFMFLPYHSHLATWTHRALCTIELAAIFLLWPLIIHPSRDMNRRTIRRQIKLAAGWPLRAMKSPRRPRRHRLRLYKQALLITSSLLFVAISFAVASFPGEPHVNLFAGRPSDSVHCARWFDNLWLRYSIDRKFDRLFLRSVDVVDDESLARIERSTADRKMAAWQGDRTRIFRGRDLNCATLSLADLRRVDLSNAYLAGADLWHADLQGASLSFAVLHGARLENTQLQGSLLEGAQLQDAFLDNARLHGAILLDASLQRASLLKTELQNASLDRAQLQKAQLNGAVLQSASLRGANLEDAMLVGADLQHAILSPYPDPRLATRLHRANLNHAQLDRALLDGAQLQDAKFVDAKMHSAVLADANLQRADLDRAVLSGSTLYKARMQGARLESAHLRGTNLADTHLQGANLSRAELQGAYLRGAKLQGALLTDAHLQGATLDQTELHGASLERAKLQAVTLTSSNLSSTIFLETRVWRARGANCTDARIVSLDHRGTIEFSQNYDGSYRISPLNREIIERFIAGITNGLPAGRWEATKDRLTDRFVDAPERDDDEAVVRESWANCPRSAGVPTPAALRKHLDELLRVACSDTADSQAAAHGIARHWLTAESVGTPTSVNLARGLLGRDGRSCAAAKGLSEATRKWVQSNADASSGTP